MRGRLCLAGLAAAALLAPLVSGCASKAQLSSILAADAARTAHGTSRVAVAFTMQGPGMTTTVTETGVFDYTHSRGVLRSGADVALTEVFLPPHVYMKLGAVLGGPPQSKPWIEMSSSGPDAMGGFPFAAFPGEPQSDPSSMLASLSGISSRVTQLGSASIRGVQTVHYRVTLDPAKAEAKMRSPEKAEFEAFMKAFAGTALPAQVWVDGQGIVRRIMFTLTPGKDSGAPAGMRLTQQVDFYDFGVPVRVSAPPASQVEDISQALKGDGSFASIGISQGDGSSGPPPPAARGSISPAQARAAERAVRAFWAGIGANDLKAAAREVTPAQRNCFLSTMKDAPKFTIRSLHITSVRPDGTGRAAVVFTMRMGMQIRGTNLPASPAGVQWLLAADLGGRWYVDLKDGTGALSSC
ncbi:MAG: hypothetical protein ACM3ML_28965 [Micromonosporaceae bacterium]